ncbi:MAG: Chemotaxis regulator - transmits chemoreceptor signals to flagelllar motor component CheY [Labilithrix sp.]|nr:Chemotaxis regulator - transmits chemoreceptor signals to flagelllar motor component CheY [Labilithrix sp.]
MAKFALVVDDSMVIRKMVSMALQAAGFEVSQAANGQEALDKATAQPFNIVVTDLNMPVMNGLDFIRAVRGVAAHKFTPIVFLTTESDEKLREEARAAGATAWVQKPFQPEKIMSVVNRIAG